MFSKFPRMLLWCMLSVVLIGLSLWAQALAPGSVLTVTLYKAHLLALGGWGGYWLDRALFPYDRPHQYLEDDDADEDWHRFTDSELTDEGGTVGSEGSESKALEFAQTSVVYPAFSSAMLRRAIIVAACLVCVGLGA